MNWAPGAPPAMMMFAMGEQPEIPSAKWDSVVCIHQVPADCGFEVMDVDIDSIELHYDGPFHRGPLAGMARFEGGHGGGV